MTRFIKLGFALLPACALELSATEQGIVGGQIAQPADFPTTVALENSPGNWFCTGTLIDKDWVLTAAHCVEGETAAGLKIRFDDANINDLTGGREVAVAAIKPHRGYNEIDWDNDIALVKLAESVTDREPTPIHRPALAAATMVVEVGYGDADDMGGGAGILRKLDTPTIDCATTGDPTVSGVNMLCFNASDGNASCYGDSGGPAYVTVDGKRAVAGVTSGGTEDSCTQGWDLYTAVAGELPFIDDVLAGGDGPLPEPDPEPTPTPEPEPEDEDDGGCNSGRNGGGLLLVGLAVIFVARRRRR